MSPEAIFRLPVPLVITPSKEKRKGHDDVAPRPADSTGPTIFDARFVARLSGFVMQMELVRSSDVVLTLFRFSAARQSRLIKRADASLNIS
jgi:hypothetical protein